MEYQGETILPIGEIINLYFEKNCLNEVNVVVVGANNGEIPDFLTNHLLKANVTGILIEPVSYLYEKLKIKFAGANNLKIENSAIYKRNGKKKIYRLNKPEYFPHWSEGLGTLKKNIILDHKNQIRDIEKHIVNETVNCITFDKLFKKHGLKEIQLLQIDTEGSDYEILMSLDLEQYRPDMIILEYLHMTFYQYYALVKFLRARNYKVIKNLSSLDLMAIDNAILE
jgi:FkbM family methyltransferase